MDGLESHEDTRSHWSPPNPHSDLLKSTSNCTYTNLINIRICDCAKHSPTMAKYSSHPLSPIAHDMSLNSLEL